ncbi:MAG: sugar ABC transporter substrate-binding protein [Actinomycetales bacterium]|nr:sugar ABC transporter substrate-binding protein [Actinomycetales bacterium]
MTMTRRSIAAIAGLAVAGLALAACSSSSTSTSGSAAAESAPAGSSAASAPAEATCEAINVFLIPSPSADAMKAMIPAFTEATGINVNVSEVEYGTAHQKALLSIQSKQGAFDVVQFDNTFLAAFAKAGALTDIGDWAANSAEYDISDIPPSLQNYGDFDGTKYGLMLSTEPFIQWYRQDIYDKLGLKPATTWDEYKANAEAIQKSGEAAGQMMGFGPNTTWWWMQLVWSFGGALYDSDFKPTVNTPEAAAATEYYKSLLASSPSGALGATGDDVTLQFVGSDIGQMVQYSGYAAGVFDPTSSKNAASIAVAPLPAGKVNAVELAGWNIGIPSDSPNPQCGWKFLEYMLGKSNAKTLLENGAAAIGRISIIDDPALQAKYPYLKLLNISPDAVVNTYPQIVVWPEFDKVASDNLAKILSGEVPVQEGLDAMQSALEPVLAKEPK